MASIRELLEARNEIYVDNAVTEDDLMKICFNKQVEKRDQQTQAKQNRKRPKEITYWSSQDRESVIVLMAITQTLENLIEDWDRLGNRPVLIIKSLRTAQTLCYKAIEYMFTGIEKKDYLRVVKDIGYHQVGILEYEPRKREG